MFITHCNRFLAKHARTALIVIAIVIVIPFVFMTRGARMFDRGPQGPGKIGRMYGEEIDKRDFFAALQATDFLQRLGSRDGRGFEEDSQLRGRWVSEALQWMRSLRRAQELGLDVVSRDQLRETIQQQFSDQDGVFDRRMFEAFKKNYAAPRGISPRRFDQIMEQRIVVGRLSELTTGGMFVSRNELREKVYLEEGQRFRVRYAEVPNRTMLPKARLVPTQEETAEYFAEHKDELRLKDRKRVRIATFPPVDPAGLQVSEEEVKEYFERNKGRYEAQKKSFDDVRDSIRKILLTQMTRRLATERVQEFLGVVRAAAAEAEGGLTPELFSEHAEKAEVSVRDYEPFTESSGIPGLESRRRLASAAYRLTPENPLSSPIQDTNGYFAAYLLEVIPGPAPEALTPEAREVVEERWLAEKIAAHYAEHIAVYRAEVDQGKTPQQIEQERIQRVRDNPDLGNDEKNQRITEIREHIQDNLTPYYEPARKKVLLCYFPAKDHADGLEITDLDLEEYYEAQAEKYQKEEVKARHILRKFSDDMDDTDKKMVRVELAAIRDDIIAGKTTFEEAAKKHSEDQGSAVKGGDLGFFGKGRMVKPFEDAAFSQEVGVVGEPVLTQYGYHIIQVEERRTGQPFETVKEEIRAAVTREKIMARARSKATDLADTAFERLDMVGRRGTPAPDVFRKVAEEFNAVPVESPWFTERGPIPRDVARAAYQLTPRNAVSNAIEQGEGYYVACWSETQPGRLPELTSDGPAGRLHAQIENYLRNRRAEELAKERAESYAEQFRQAMEKDRDIDKLAKRLDLELQAPDPFGMRQPPRGMPSAWKIMSSLRETPCPSVLDPIDTPQGWLVVLFEERLLPNEKEMQEAMDSRPVAMMLQYQKSGERRQAFTERLEEASDTQLEEGWQYDQ